MHVKLQKSETYTDIVIYEYVKYSTKYIVIFAEPHYLKDVLTMMEMRQKAGISRTHVIRSTLCFRFVNIFS